MHGMKREHVINKYSASLIDKNVFMSGVNKQSFILRKRKKRLKREYDRN